MKILSGKKIAIGVMSAICAVCACFAVAQVRTEPQSVRAQQLVTTQEIAEAYAYGATFVAPDGKVTYQGEQLDATGVYVKFPDGTMKNGDTHVLTVVGKYTVIYSAVFDGKTVTAEKEFTVNEPAYTAPTTSSVEYVHDLTTTESADDRGLKVTLAEGDSFQYNDVINLAESTADQPLITLFPYTYSILAENVSVESHYTVVRLTDYYDADNYVEICMGYQLANAAVGRYHPYVVAGASNQSKSGLSPYSGTDTSRKTVYVDNERYRVFYGTNDYGTEMDATPDTPVNGVNINNFDNYGMSVYYEAATKRIYVREKYTHLITDLDDPVIYDRNLFEGFTTGEAILSVYADGYEKETATYEISQINGVQGEALNRFELSDVRKPEIILSDDANDFYVAKGEEFTLFEATAKDKNLVGDVKAYVYYEYGTDYQTSVTVRDGKFTPAKNGKYTVLYVAKDAFGNVAERAVTCTCITAENNRLVNFQTTPVSSARAGEVTVLNAYEVSAVNEGAFAEIYAIFNGDPSTKQAIDGASREFFPRCVGQYEIVYEYGDAIKSYVYSYPLTVTPSDNVGMDAPLLPKYLIKGAKYSFEPVSAETYLETYPVAVTPEVYASVDGGAYGSAPVDYDEYLVGGAQSVRFQYVYQGKTVYESEAVPVVDVGFADVLHLEKYFVGDCETVAETDRVRITAKENAEAASADFINAVSFSQFALNFSVPAAYSSFEAVNIVLTDYYDYGKTLSIRYAKTGGGTAFSVGGSSPVAGATPFASTVHQLWYDEAAVAFTDASGNSYEIENPFTSDKVYISIRLEGVRGESAVDVYKIGSQFIGSDGYDWVKSTLYVPDAVSGIVDYGTVLSFAPAQISDVLTPYVESSYTFYVLGPGDEYVTSVEGVLLDGTQNLKQTYTVALTEYGMYRGVYEYYDQFGNPADNVVVLYVNDRVAPQLSLADGYGANTTVQASLGEQITVAGYTVTDNFGAEAVTVTVRAISPDNEMVKPEGNTFTATKKGTWKVTYYATDAEGNYALAYYTVHVA